MRGSRPFLVTSRDQIQAESKPKPTGLSSSPAPFLLPQDSVPACLFYPHVRYHTQNKLAGRRPGEATRAWVVMELEDCAEHLVLPVGIQERNKGRGETAARTDGRRGIRALGSISQLLVSPKAALLFCPALTAAPVLLYSSHDGLSSEGEIQLNFALCSWRSLW